MDSSLKLTTGNKRDQTVEGCTLKNCQEKRVPCEVQESNTSSVCKHRKKKLKVMEDTKTQLQAQNIRHCHLEPPKHCCER